MEKDEIIIGFSMSLLDTMRYFLFKVGEENDTLSCVTDLLHRVPHKDDIIPMEFEIDPAKFIPGSASKLSFLQHYLLLHKKDIFR